MSESITLLPRGGFRIEAGCKANQNYADVADTKVVRVPVGFDEVAAVANIEQLRVLVETANSTPTGYSLSSSCIYSGGFRRCG
ncbi:MAG: hypothetical protein KAF91_27150 [Nostoc sp. TH1S01]|nr:hypothetical protein [Nostoc sp. TH1S01]